jgi:Zn ribbon nucleic-acid-binding protein
MASRSDMSTFPWAAAFEDVRKVSKILASFALGLGAQLWSRNSSVPLDVEDADIVMLRALPQQLGALFSSPAPHFNPAEMDTSALQQTLHESESRVRRFIGWVIRVECSLVCWENGLLCAVAMEQDPELMEERNLVRLRIALLRYARATGRSKLRHIIRACHSEGLRSIDHKHLLAAAFQDMGLTATRVCEPFAAVSLGASGIDADALCPICQEFLALNPVEEETSPPSLIQTRNCCKQIYHLHCLLSWLRTPGSARGGAPATCPTCRAKVDLQFFVEALEMKITELEAS